LLVARPGGPGKLEAGEGLAALGDPRTWHEALANISSSVSLHPVRHSRFVSLWLVKRILQKLGVRRHKQCGHFVEKYHGREASASLPVPVMSVVSKRILKFLLPSLGKIAQRRLRNLLLWDELLLEDYAEKIRGLTATVRAKGREWTPYQAGFRAETSASESLFVNMQKMGLPVMTWPDLPPEVCINKERASAAWDLHHNHIYLPLHQSLSAEDIITSIHPKKGISSSSSGSCEISWNTATRSQWHDWLTQVSQSNLLQSWSYGEAKAGQGWRVRRGVISISNKPVAIVQVLERSYLGTIKLSRVNRGPLFLRHIEGHLQNEVVECLIKELSGIYRGRVLSFAPEMSLTGVSIRMLSQFGLKQFSPDSWESIWLDLSDNAEILRKKLDGKWRNMLSFAERQDLSMVVEKDKDSFEWILEKCQRMMREREGPDVPVNLYKSLWCNLDSEGKSAMVFRAFAESEVVAGICIIPHGAAATYLLGWNGRQGRKLKANQFLLWNAIIFLQQEGFQWFDLGGIDEENNSGIASFKLGINGARYSLAGEFWKW
jgi:hypothetical protein